MIHLRLGSGIRMIGVSPAPVTTDVALLPLPPEDCGGPGGRPASQRSAPAAVGRAAQQQAEQLNHLRRVAALDLEDLGDHLAGVGNIELGDDILDPHEIGDRVDHEQSPGRLVGADVSVLAHQRPDDLAHLGGRIIRELEDLLDDLVGVLERRQRLVRPDHRVDAQPGLG